MPSPMKRRHGKAQLTLAGCVVVYESATPGIEAFDGSTVILGPDSEAQPDISILISPECGGRTRVKGDYIWGSPELLIETASSTESYDLHRKKRDYEAGGVREYVVIALRQAKVFQFALRGNKFEEQVLGADGILRSEPFPGLWLEPTALLNRDYARLLEVLRQGISAPAHAAFVEQLTASRKP